MKRNVSVTRVLVGTGIASGAALLGLVVGLPILAATAAGAAVGGATVAAMASRH